MALTHKESWSWSNEGLTCEGDRYGFFFFSSVNTVGFSYPLRPPFTESPNGNVEFGDVKGQLESKVAGGFLVSWWGRHP